MWTRLLTIERAAEYYHVAVVAPQGIDHMNPLGHKKQEPEHMY